MKRLLRLFMVTVLLLATGCQPARQAIVDISLEDAENVKMMREVSERFRKDWLVKSGFFDGLNIREEELPYEVVKAKEKLDLLAEKEELTDYELGYFLGLKVLLSSSVVQAILEKYAPDVVELLPLVF